MVVFYWWILSLVKQGWWWPSKVTMITRFARARTLFWSIYRPRDLSTAVLQGSFYLANMTRYKYIPIGRILPGQKISAAYSLGVIPKIFLFFHIDMVDLLKGHLGHPPTPGWGADLPAEGDATCRTWWKFQTFSQDYPIYLLNIRLYYRRCLSSLPCGNVGILL